MNVAMEKIRSAAIRCEPELTELQERQLSEIAYTCSENDVLYMTVEDLVFAYSLVQMVLNNDFDNSMKM